MVINPTDVEVELEPGKPRKLERLELLSEEQYMKVMETLPEGNELLEDTDPNKFIAKMGAEAIYDLLQNIDLVTLAAELRERANTDGSY